MPFQFVALVAWMADGTWEERSEELWSATGPLKKRERETACGRDIRTKEFLVKSLTRASARRYATVHETSLWETHRTYE